MEEGCVCKILEKILGRESVLQKYCKTVKFFCMYANSFTLPCMQTQDIQRHPVFFALPSALIGGKFTKSTIK